MKLTNPYAIIKKYGTKEKIMAAYDRGEVNVMGVVIAVIMLTVGISLVTMFSGIFPAVTGNVITSQNVTAANPLYPVVSALPQQAVGWYNLNGTVMTIGIVAVLAGIALSIFVFNRRT